MHRELIALAGSVAVRLGAQKHSQVQSINENRWAKMHENTHTQA